MSSPKKIRFRGAIYEAVELPLDLLHAELVEAAGAAPRSKEEWQEFASDVFDFYKNQLSEMGALRELEDGMGSLRELLASAKKDFRKAKHSKNVLDILQALVSARYLAGTTSQSSSLVKGLKSIKKWAKQHEKLKKKMEKMRQPKQKIKKWFK